MIYLFTSGDGECPAEGICSVAQCQIHTFVLSRLLNVKFLGRDLINLHHYQGIATQEKFSKDASDFFNFELRDYDISKKNIIKFDNIDDKLINFVNSNKNKSEDIFIEINRDCLQKFSDNNFDSFKDMGLHSELFERVKFDDSKYYFDDSKINVSLHLRTFVKNLDFDLSPDRERYSKGNAKEKYYITLIKKLDDILNRRGKTLFKDKEYHIFSRGNKEDFEAFTKLGVNIKLHIDEHPLSALYHITKSDIRILSNSSFSYLPALLGENLGVSIIRSTFSPRRINNYIVADYEGNFNESLLCFEDN